VVSEEGVRGVIGVRVKVGYMFIIVQWFSIVCIVLHRIVEQVGMNIG